jgi:hypothetical protein
MSKNANYIYPSFAMSNDINWGGWGVKSRRKDKSGKTKVELQNNQ